MPITVAYVIFQKLFGGACPQSPPRIILVSQFASNSTLPEKYALKMSKFGAEDCE